MFLTRAEVLIRYQEVFLSTLQESFKKMSFSFCFFNSTLTFSQEGSGFIFSKYKCIVFLKSDNSERRKNQSKNSFVSYTRRKPFLAICRSILPVFCVYM